MSDESPIPAETAAGEESQLRAADTTVVHLLRHGEVETPKGVIYGRIPGFGLSEDGRMMAKAAADHLAERDVVAIFTSPLERARETAEPLAERFSLEPIVDDRLIEPWNHFEGLVFGGGGGSLRRPEHWWDLRNPLSPSWGERYRLIVARMLGAMAAAPARGRGPGPPRGRRGGVRDPPPADLGHPPVGGRQAAVAPPQQPGVRAGQRDQLHLHRGHHHRRELLRAGPASSQPRGCGTIGIRTTICRSFRLREISPCLLCPPHFAASWL